MPQLLNGIDSSTPCTAASIKCLTGSAIKFVGRYFSRTTTTDKKLTRPEALLISKAGLRIVSLYEDGPTKISYFTAARGGLDAKGAIDQATTVGQPNGSAIYFTVDFDAE